MIKKTALFLLAAAALILGSAPVSFGQWFIDVENGLALPGYNDVRIPGDTGTLFSFADDLKTDPAYFFRFRAGIHWKSRHTVSFLAAPLRLHAAGTFDRPVFFYEETFPAGVPVTGTYKFNSVRLTYRYDFIRKGKWRVGAGLTGKIRDAAVGLEGGGLASTKTNIGCVPLLHLRVLWQFREAWGLLLEADGAAAAPGRAEDVLLALQWKLKDNLTLKAGYRILEGGADVEEVYNFSLIHYLGAGLTFTF
ncbi:MAG: hypothetical protein R6X21_12260 [Candidatus Aminicenantes bacterium]